jgi:hypothetical protein
MKTGMPATSAKRLANARADYLSQLPKLSRPHEKFDAALRLLVPDGEHERIVALFDGRVSYSAIKHWRKGRNAIPIWVQERITQAMQPIERLCQELKKMPAPPKRGTGLAMWKANRFS